MLRIFTCRALEPMDSPHGGNGWRCQRFLIHRDPHRFVNYVWWTGGKHAYYCNPHDGSIRRPLMEEKEVRRA